MALVEAYAKEQGLWSSSVEPVFSEKLELDLATVEPSLAGPSRPQDRVSLSGAQQSLHTALASAHADGGSGADAGIASRSRATLEDGTQVELGDGSVVIAAITSCTNTSNPFVLVAAGLLARNAVELGIRQKPWVKTSLAPGSRVVMDYLGARISSRPLETLGIRPRRLRMHHLHRELRPAPSRRLRGRKQGSLSVAAVLSGNRNFEGRVHNEVRLNYLASPPLVVAYALAGTMDFDPLNDPIAETPDGNPVTLADLWPSDTEVVETVRAS